MASDVSSEGASVRPITAVVDREATLARTFIELADTLVDRFDLVEMLTALTDRCVDIFSLAAAGLTLASPEGALAVIASSNDAIRGLERYELLTDEGPCLDCYQAGQPVHCDDLDGARDRWPRFAPHAVASGFRAVHAFPMRLRGRTIGALDVFVDTTDAMPAADIDAIQAFADIATIAILQHRAAAEAQVVNEQLTHALQSRVIIEQAKGMIAQYDGVSMEHAFAILRNFARGNNRGLAGVAHAVVAGEIELGALEVIAAPRARR